MDESENILELTDKPATGRQIALQILVPFVIGGVIALAAGLICYAIRGIGISWGLFLFSGFFAGFGFMLFVAMVKQWNWIEATPVYKHWKNLLGESIGRPVMVILFLFMFAVGLFASVAPALFAKPGGRNANQAINANNPRPGRTRQPPQEATNTPFVAQQIEKIESNDRGTRLSGLLSVSFIMSGTYGSYNRTQLRQAVVKCLTSSDEDELRNAIRAIVICGTAEDIPALEKCVANAPDIFLQRDAEDAIHVLKKRQDSESNKGFRPW